MDRKIHILKFEKGVKPSMVFKESQAIMGQRGKHDVSSLTDPDDIIMRNPRLPGVGSIPQEIIYKDEASGWKEVWGRTREIPVSISAKDKPEHDKFMTALVDRLKELGHEVERGESYDW